MLTRIPQPLRCLPSGDEETRAALDEVSAIAHLCADVFILLLCGCCGWA